MSETGMAMMGTGSAAGDDRAREAAEAAVSSPLLEDINLAGAQGILVNVTAGMDLSIGEFQEVGNVVKQFASDDATVVVGTVIDPDMANQIRVTVVATGLGKPVAKVQPAPVQQQSIAPPLTMRVVRPKTPISPTDYAILDKPTVQRQRAVGDGLRNEVDTEDLLDIPAFLRRQAD
jgi:cell division protein FtsZ